MNKLIIYFYDELGIEKYLFLGNSRKEKWFQRAFIIIAIIGLLSIMTPPYGNEKMAIINWVPLGTSFVLFSLTYIFIENTYNSYAKKNHIIYKNKRDKFRRVDETIRECRFKMLEDYFVDNGYNTEVKENILKAVRDKAEAKTNLIIPISFGTVIISAIDKYFSFIFDGFKVAKVSPGKALPVLLLIITTVFVVYLLYLIIIHLLELNLNNDKRICKIITKIYTEN